MKTNENIWVQFYFSAGLFQGRVVNSVVFMSQKLEKTENFV